MPFDPSKPCNRPVSTKAGIGFVLRLLARETSSEAPSSMPQTSWLTWNASAPLVQACPWRPQRG